MRKKLLSVLLILSILLSLLPVTALAADGTLPDAVEGVITIMKSGTYTIGPEVTDQIKVSGAGVTLVFNNAGTKQIEVNAAKTVLVVNGSLTAGDAASPAITNSGSLEIQGSGTISAVWDNYVVNNSGTLTIKDNVTINGGTGISSTGGTLTVNGGAITGSGKGITVSGGTANVTGGEISGGTGIEATGGKLTVAGGAKVTGSGKGIVVSGGMADVTGGEISGGTGIEAASGTLTVANGAKITGNDKGVVVSGGTAGSGALTVTGGTISGGSGSGAGITVSGGTADVTGGEISGGTGIEATSGTLTVASGAKITGSGKGISVSGGTLNITGGDISGANALYFNGTSETITASVSGGTFTSSSGSEAVSGTGPENFITGGIFSSTVNTKFLDSSKETAQQPNGKYQIIEKGSSTQRPTDVAQVDGVNYYPTLEAAFAAAKHTGGKVTLVDWVDKNSVGNLVVEKDLTLEINSKTSLGLDLGEGSITVSGEKGALTIYDSEPIRGNIKSSGLQTIIVKDGASLVVKGVSITNTSVNLGNSSSADPSAAILVKGKSTVSIESGKVEAAGRGGVGVSIMQNGTLNLYGGSVTAKGDNGIGVNLAEEGSVLNMTTKSGSSGTEEIAVEATGVGGIGVCVMQKGTLTVDKGTISAENKNGCAVYQPQFGATKINNGTVTGQAGIVAHAGRITVNNGTIRASGNSNINVSSGQYAASVSPAGIVFDRRPSSAGGQVFITDGQVLAAAGQKAVVYTREGRAPNPTDDDYLPIVIPETGTNKYTGLFSSSVSEYVDKQTYMFESKSINGFCYYKVFKDAVVSVQDSGNVGTVTGLGEGSPVYNIRFNRNDGTSAPAVGTLFVHKTEKYYVGNSANPAIAENGWPDAPTLEGNTFKGWFTTGSKSGGEEITLTGGTGSISLDDFLKDRDNADITLYARWSENGAFKVNSAYYDTLESAIEAAGDTHGITITRAVTLAKGEEPITYEAKVNIYVQGDLNLGGNTLSFTSGHGLVIEASGSEGVPMVTVTNGTIASDNTAVLISGSGRVTVSNATITGNNYGVKISGGELIVESAILKGSSGTGAGIYAFPADNKDITVTIGQEGADNSKISVSGPTALYLQSGAGTITAHVNSGTFMSAVEGGKPVDATGTDLKGFISGGDFSASVVSSYLVDSLTYEAKAASGDAPYSYYAKIVDAVKAAGQGGTVKNKNGTPVYVINFDLNYAGASRMPGPAYVNDGKAENWPDDPTRSGYAFDGWHTGKEDGDKVDLTYSFTKDTTVYAHWKKGAPYTVIFNANGGKIDGKPTATVTTDKDGKLDKWPTAAFDGHTFDAWYTASKGGDKVNLTYAFKEDTTVYAHWVYTITFEANGGKINGKATVTETTDEDGKLDPSKIPTPDRRAGYTFDGWYTVDKDAVPFDFTSPFEKNTTLSAHWTKEEGSSVYTITFHANGGTFEDAGETIQEDTGEDGILKESDLPKAIRSGYTFDDWYTAASGGKTVDFSYSFTKDTTVYAHWTKNEDPIYTITFDANGGKIDGKTTVKATTDKDGKVDKWPAKPTRSGYTFDDWYTAKTDGDKVPSDHRFTKDTTVYAHWTKDSSGGNSSDDEDTLYSIRISDSRHGSVSSSHTSAKAGTKVELTVIPETDYIAEVEVRPAKGTAPKLNRNGKVYTFTMPASNVTVDVEFSLQAAYNTFVPPQSQSSAQTNTQTSLPASAFTPVTWRPAASMKDVPANSWAYPAAQWAYQNGYLDTAADGSFRLNGTVSHMQLWKIMAQWLGEPVLDDNSVSQWARKSGAARVGAASGTMTRQNMVEYLYQCYFLMGGDVSVSGNLIQYRDGQQITSGSARNAWLWAVNKGIISGTTDGYLNPNGVLTRGEFATILMRLCQSK